MAEEKKVIYNVEVKTDSNSLKKLDKASQDTSKSINKLNETTNKAGKESKLMKQYNEAGVGSINKLKTANKLYQKELENLNQTTKDGKLRATEITKSMQANEKTLESMGGTTKKMGVASEEASEKSIGMFSKMGSGIKGLFKTFIANPIGLLIVAIVGGLKMLYDAFNRSSEGQDKMAKGMGIIKGLLNTVMQVFNSFATVVMKAIDDPKKAWDGLVDGFKTGTKFIKTQVVGRINGYFTKMGGEIALTFSKIRLAWNKLWKNEEGIAAAEKDISEANKKIAAGAKEIEIANTSLKGVIDDVKDSFIEFGKEAKKNIEISQKITAATLAFKRLNVAITKGNAELNKQKIIQEQIADDATLSLAEREKAAIKIIKLDTKIAKNVVSLARNAESNARAEAKAKGDTSVESQQNIANLMAARKTSEGEYVVVVANANKRVREIRSDNFEIALDAEVDFTDKKAQALIKQSQNEDFSFKERKEALLKLTTLTNESYDRQLDLVNKFSDTKIDKNKIAELSDAKQVKAYLDGLGLSEVITNRVLNDIIRERETVNADIKSANDDLNEAIKSSDENSLESKIDNLTKSAKFEKDLIDGTVDNNEEAAKQKLDVDIKYAKDVLDLYIQQARADKILTEEEEKNINIKTKAYEQFIKDREVLRTNSLSSEEIEFKKRETQFKQLLDNKIISLEEYNEEIDSIEEERRVYQKEKKDLENIEDAEKAIGQAQLIVGMLSDLSNALTENELTEQENKYNGIDKAAKTAYDNEVARIKAKGLSEEAEKKELDNLNKTFTDDQIDRDKKRDDAERKIKKEAFEREKKLNIISVIINAATGIMQAFAQLGPIGGIVGAALIAATGVLQLSTISQQQFQGATGGKLIGDLHSQASGGIQLSPNMMAEGGEFLINKAATQKYEPLLDSINSTGNANNDTSSVSEMIDYEKMGEVIRMNIKTHIVSSEMTDQQEEDNRIVELSQFGNK